MSYQDVYDYLQNLNPYSYYDAEKILQIKEFIMALNSNEKKNRDLYLLAQKKGIVP